MTARRDTTAIGWTHFPDGYLGVELPEPLDEKQWPAAVDRFGQRGRIWRT